MNSMLRRSKAAHPFKPRAGLTLVFGGAFASITVGAWAQTAQPDHAADAPAAVTESTQPTTALPSIIVVGTIPLVGAGTPLEKVPANVQTIKGGEIDAQHAQTVTDYLQKNVSSVDVNDTQSNPSQMDILYRGFTASPLLGTPQGLSVFLDDVRVNEPFGDVVNWDLIPQNAIQTMQLIPGSNPTFGLNTLGGAIAVQTNNGRSNPGGNADISFGSFGRKRAAIEQGGVIGDHLDYYFTANITNDNGWADHNASRLRQAFGKLRYTDADRPSPYRWTARTTR